MNLELALPFPNHFKIFNNTLELVLNGFLSGTGTLCNPDTLACSTKDIGSPFMFFLGWNRRYEVYLT